MTKNELNAKLCAVLTTLAEVPSAPETIIYMATCEDLGEWETVKQVLTLGNLATVTNHEVRITEAGRAMADKINKAMGVTHG